MEGQIQKPLLQFALFVVVSAIIVGPVASYFGVSARTSATIEGVLVGLFLLTFVRRS